MNRQVFRVLLALGISFAAALAASAQTASITGNVTDASGGVIVNAQVQVVNQATSLVVANTKTDAMGNFAVQSLPAGRYQITVRTKGFGSNVAAVTLTDGQALSHDVKLGISGGATSVTVTGQVESIPNPNPDIAVGPFTATPLQDLPYSITVVPSTLMENIQAYQPEDLFSVVPQITNILPQQNSTGNPFFYLRGFSVTEFTNGAGVTYDGLLNAGPRLDAVLEDKERAEVLSGVDGFLYGIGSVGGNINYVLKRPTPTLYASVTVGDNDGANGYVHGDFGGPLFDSGRVGYRLNVVAQDGPTSIDQQSIKRDLVSATVDVHLRSNLLLQFNASQSDYHIFGLTPSYSIPSLNPYPKPADPSKIFNPSWLQFIDDSATAGTRLTWNIGKRFTLRTAYNYSLETRPTQESISTTITNYAGAETQRVNGGGEILHWYTHSAYMFLDSHFSTFGLQHMLTIGYTGSYYIAHEAPQTESFAISTLGSNNFYDQIGYPQPAPIWGTDLNYTYNRALTDNFVIGDQVNITQRFTLLAGGNLVVDKNHWFNGSGQITAANTYDSSKVTPALALLYKPLPWLSPYVSFQESLQPGTEVMNSGTTIYTNNGAVLAPYLGYQTEGGVKATVANGVLLTAAIFDIDKANQYTISNLDGTFTVVQSGREVHKGIELTASGNVRRDLMLIGGVTLLDPKIVNNPTTPAQDGDLPQDVSTTSGKLYVEFTLPSRLRYLTLIGGGNYVGSQYVNLPNTTAIPAFIVGDLGLRYTLNFSERPLIFRFNVDNVANNAYWISPGREGLPRTFLGTVEWRLK